MPTTTTLTPRQKEIFDLIRQTVEEQGYPPSLREIARHFGMSGTRAVEKHIQALEKKGYLRKGAGARALEVVGRPSGRSIPVLGRVAAGKPILAEENLLGSLTVDAALGRWKDIFLLKVRGESMKEAGILNGDLVLVKQQLQAENGEIVVALMEDEATVKRFYRRGDRIELKPENPDYQSVFLRKGDHIHIIGKVMGVLRLPFLF